MRHSFVCALSLSVTASLIACSSDDGVGGIALPPDASMPDAMPAPDASDAAAPDVADVEVPDTSDAALPRLAPYERFPTVDYLGGALLTSMKVVTVTFASDSAQTITQLQTFGDTIGQTPWWTATTSEYCVMPKGSPCIGPATSGGHVVLQEAAPTNLVDTEDGNNSSLAAFIQDHVTSGLFPRPDDQTIFVLYFPSTTTISFQGMKSCANFGAYHFSTPIMPSGGSKAVETAYAVEPRCGDMSYTTFAASHELIEAATDAHPRLDNGYLMQDFGWLYFGGEVGDLCDLPWDFLSMNQSGFNVQRGWSNKSARSGHDPCVPQAPGEVYFNVAPQAGMQRAQLAVGQSVTFDLEAYADGSTADWKLSAEDVSDRTGGNKTLAFAFDKTSVHAGQTVKLTLKLTQQPAQGFASYVIHSQSGAGHHWWGATVQMQ